MAPSPGNSNSSGQTMLVVLSGGDGWQQQQQLKLVVVVIFFYSKLFSYNFHIFCNIFYSLSPIFLFKLVKLKQCQLERRRHTAGQPADATAATSASA
jgi:hypothetical protein